ncbi:TetR family transcriptional regulator [Curtobacterium sp. ISL-83]|uniref:acyl-CoA-like ligand-binding transcription factor n=1 Tax=Curtobacterium sp. ISL-83 TaxID=2819145 RepID=UPI001BE4F089|nr:TetR family transcriptional regulator [Curtobacterium sp. ISL-83]MBT2501247.1 TetR family transcriptional regulator [Curtobacterium sp. ISL-83]
MVGMSTRAIGRAAIRDELGNVALGRFLDSGFDPVTFDDLAGRAGVSRSTFLRYFRTKEDVVLYVFDALGEQMASALAARPSAEDDWTALRAAVTPAVALLEDDEANGFARIQLVWSTPALSARLHEKQAGWRPALVDILARRSGNSAPTIALRTRAMAALGCVMVAYDGWIESGGAARLASLADDAFAALAPQN